MKHQALTRQNLLFTKYIKTLCTLWNKKRTRNIKISKKKYILKITKWYVHTRMSLTSPEFSSIIWATSQKSYKNTLKGYLN